MTATKLAFVGGFGHMVDVLSDLQSQDAPPVNVAGCAPAHEGENLDALSRHPFFPGRDSVRVYDSIDSLLGAEQPEILVVSTRPDRIAGAIRAGVQAGCHIISEKPLALDLTELSSLQALAGKARRAVLGMLSMRRLPLFRLARERVEAGCIGPVSLINTRKSYKWGHRPHWFRNRAQYGGTWPWIGIHNVDMAHFLTGRHVTKGTAFHACRVHTDFASCEDVATGNFALEDGILMTASIDYLRPEIATTHGDDWCRVVGEKGVIEVSVARNEVRVMTDSGEETVQVETAPQPLYAEWIRDLASQPDTVVGDDTAFRLTRAALAARDAADSGKPFDLNMP